MPLKKEELMKKKFVQMLFLIPFFVVRNQNFCFVLFLIRGIIKAAGMCVEERGRLIPDLITFD